jgi:hypothetical protein
MAMITIIGAKGGKHLVEGQEYKVTEQMAELLIRSKQAYEKGKEPKAAPKKAVKKGTKKTDKK